MYIGIGLLLAFLGVVCGSTRFVDPFQPGPHEVRYFNISSGSYEGVDENLDIYTPLTPGTYPVLYFIDGFAMGVPGTAYSDIIIHLASHGVMVIAPWMIKLLTPESKLPYLTSVMDWAESNLENVLHNDSLPLDVKLDFQTLLASTHSAGSHVTVALLKEGCRNFKGLVLISPVDGVDAAGLIPEFCITPGENLNFAIPTLHLYGGYDPKPGFSGLACAPEKLSNERFWNALSPDSHRWSINATEFAHQEYLDEFYRLENEVTHFCGFNEDLPKDVYPVFRNFAAGSTVAFFRALFDANCNDYLVYLEDPNLMSVDTTERHVNPTGACPTPYCTWEPLL